MDKAFKFAGDTAAGLGILLCIVAGVARLAGNYHIFGFQAVTLLIVGIALMVMACLVKLQLIAARFPRSGQ